MADDAVVPADVTETVSTVLNYTTLNPDQLLVCDMIYPVFPNYDPVMPARGSGGGGGGITVGKLIGG